MLSVQSLLMGESQHSVDYIRTVIFVFTSNLYLPLFSIIICSYIIYFWQYYDYLRFVLNSDLKIIIDDVFKQ